MTISLIRAYAAPQRQARVERPLVFGLNGLSINRCWRNQNRLADVEEEAIDLQEPKACPSDVPRRGQLLLAACDSRTLAGQATFPRPPPRCLIAPERRLRWLASSCGRLE